MDIVRARLKLAEALAKELRDDKTHDMGIPQPKVSKMMRGDFSHLSEHKLMACLNRLGYDIEIKVRPAAAPLGQLTLAIA